MMMLYLVFICYCTVVVVLYNMHIVSNHYVTTILLFIDALLYYMCSGCSYFNERRCSRHLIIITILFVSTAYFC